MGILAIPAAVLILAILAFLAFINYAVVRDFQQRKSSLAWVALCISWLLGAIVGVWSGFHFSYLLDPEMRVHGAPFPAAFQVVVHQDGQDRWIYLPVRTPWLSAAWNVLILTMVAGAIVWGVMTLIGKTTTRNVPSRS